LAKYQIDYIAVMNMDGLKESVFRFLKLDSFISNLSGYVESKVELVKLEIREDVARLLSKSIVYGVIILLAFLFLIFFSIGIAQYMNTFFEDSFAGYLIVALVYAITFFLFLLFRKSIYKSFERRFSEMIRSKEK
jgi:uncharacterized membrane protein YqjE